MMNKIFVLICLSILWQLTIYTDFGELYKSRVDTRTEAEIKRTQKLSQLKDNEFKARENILDEMTKRQKSKLAPEPEDETEQPEPEDYELSLHDWLHQAKEHVTTARISSDWGREPSHEEDKTTPFHEAVINGDIQMGQSTISAARVQRENEKKITPDELLQPIKDHYDSLVNSGDLESAHTLVDNVSAMGNDRLTKNMKAHSIQKDLEKVVNSFKSKENWNIYTGKDAVMNKRWTPRDTQNLPITEMEQIIRSAVIHNIPLDTLLESFQPTASGKTFEKGDPGFEKHLQKTQRKLAQRTIIERLYKQVETDFKKAHATAKEGGGFKLKTK